MSALTMAEEVRLHDLRTADADQNAARCDRCGDLPGAAFFDHQWLCVRCCRQAWRETEEERWCRQLSKSVRR